MQSTKAKNTNLSAAVLAQAKQASNQMQLIKNGSINDAINFATEDFYKATKVLKRATKDYTVPYMELPQGLRFFVHQQFFRLNAAAMMCDALGYQSITNVLVIMHPEMDAYMRTTMAMWNNTIESEGDVAKMFEQIAAEEAAQDNPPAAMQ